MFKKIVNLSCFLSAVLAEGEVKSTESTPVALAEARDGNIVNQGYIGETFTELDGD